MIAIRKLNLEELAIRHYNSILKYANRPLTRRIKIDLLNQWLESNLSITFKKLIIATPKELEAIKLKYDGTLSLLNNPFKCLKSLYIDFSSVNSPLLYNLNEKYSGYEFVAQLETTVCPYCNRNFIHNTAKKRTSELDHFYDKSEYSIFAMSFFNLIPSCKSCNQHKSNCKAPLVNPYDDRYNVHREATFRLGITNVDAFYNKNELKLEYNPNEDSKIKVQIDNAIKVFSLNDLYQNHKDYALELIHKNIVYNEDYINSLYQQYEGTLFKNREDVLRLITTNYIEEQDLGKRPLAKLTRDIVESLDLI